MSGRDKGDAKESRFAKLLEPVRDLVENWGIDLAADLDEYLSELEHLTYNFEGADDGANKGLNFAEAALLIQGSACVYSKKVEYLYSLLYQTMEALIAKRKQQKASVGADGADADATELFGDDEPTLMSLDDHIKEGKNIDLVESDKSYEEERKSTLLVRAPLSLIVGTADGGGNGSDDSYAVSRCVVHTSGALLLEERDSALVDAQLSAVQAARSNPLHELPFGSPRAINLGITLEKKADGAAAGKDAADAAKDAAALAAGDAAPMDAFDASADDGDNDNDDGPVMNLTAALNEAVGSGDVLSQPTTLSQQAQALDAKHSSVLGDAANAVSAAAGKGKGKGATAASHDDNPWRILDPHDDSSATIKPAKKGKTWRVSPLLPDESVGVRPDGNSAAAVSSFLDVLHTPASAAVQAIAAKQAIALSAFGGASSSSNAAAAAAAGSTGTTAAAASAWLKLPHFAEFNALFADQVTSRAREVRRVKAALKGNAAALRQKPAQGLMAYNPNAFAPVVSGVVANGGADSDDDDDGVGVQDFGGLDLSGDLTGAPAPTSSSDGAAPLNADDGWGDDKPPQAAALAHQQSDDGPHMDFDKMPDPTAFDQLDVSGTYEALVKQQFLAYQTNAKRFAVETQLRKRVNEWQDKLAPILKAVDQRPAFDIYEYGVNLIDKIQHADEHVPSQPDVVSFGHAMAGRERFDVCRYFLASLQLANSGNVEIVAASDADAAKDLNAMLSDDTGADGNGNIGLPLRPRTLLGYRLLNPKVLKPEFDAVEPAHQQAAAKQQPVPSVMAKQFVAEAMEDSSADLNGKSAKAGAKKGGRKPAAAAVAPKAEAVKPKADAVDSKHGDAHSLAAALSQPSASSASAPAAAAARAPLAPLGGSAAAAAAGAGTPVKVQPTAAAAGGRKRALRAPAGDAPAAGAADTKPAAAAAAAAGGASASSASGAAINASPAPKRQRVDASPLQLLLSPPSKLKHQQREQQSATAAAAAAASSSTSPAADQENKLPAAAAAATDANANAQPAVGRRRGGLKQAGAAAAAAINAAAPVKGGLRFGDSPTKAFQYEADSAFDLPPSKAAAAAAAAMAAAAPVAVAAGGAKSRRR